MNEASVSSPLMSELRKQLRPSKVIKHADKSMIGLPDCSVHHNKTCFWLEFKFYEMKKKWVNNRDSDTVFDIMADVEKKSPVQAQMMRELDVVSSGAYYVIWVKKTCVYIVAAADTTRYAAFRTTGEAVLAIVNRICHGRLQV